MAKATGNIIVIFSLIFACACGDKMRQAQTTAKTVPQKIITTEETVPELPAPPEEIPEPEKEIFLVASILKTACYGNCPVFEFSIYSDGRMEYRGKQHSVMKGLYEAYTDGAVFDDISHKAAIAGFMDFADRYPVNGASLEELPNTFTYIKINEQEKQIRNNHDCPNALLAFEKYLMGWIDKVNWKKINPAKN